MKKGHKLNSYLNKQWAKHAGSKWMKRFTSKKRRRIGKKEITSNPTE